MNSPTDYLINMMLLVGAIGVGVVVGRGTGGQRPASNIAASSPVPDWRSYTTGGHRLGPEDAQVTVVVFTDYECPFCRLLEPSLVALRARYPRDIAVVIRNLPNKRIHPASEALAYAAECAADQGAFETMHKSLMEIPESQDGVDALFWRDLGASVGLGDPGEFMECVVSQKHQVAVNNDMASARRLGVTGTPTLLINETLIAGIQPFDALEALVRTKGARR